MEIKTEETRRVNHMSDFDAILRLTDCRGNDIGWPECDWRARFWSASKSNAYEASCIGGECRNCFNDGGRIHVVFKDHRMGVGTLQCRLTLDLPDGIYPDGIRRDVSPAPLGVELVNGAGDCPTTAEIEMLLPFIKGDQGEKMTYADLTEDDKRDLISPLTAALDDYVTTEDLDVAKRAVFDDQFLAAAGTWGKIDHTHVENGVSKPYYLNELWLTYKEAVAVMDWGAITTYSTLARYRGAKIRTNLPPRVGATSDGSTTAAFDIKYFDQSSNIEILNLACEPQAGNYGFVVNPQGAGSDFGLSGSKLRKVLGIVNLGKLTSFWTYLLNTPKLEEIRISHLRVNFTFRFCPLISAASIRYLIGQRMGTAAITVTLHSDTYARLTAAVDDPDNEWYGLID
ncbi:MAG: hypothetical protein K2I45_07025, partial [Muribaculaceae bacterium]|nr:hypothetical protein [Muribaculaceae bacterium]